MGAILFISLVLTKISSFHVYEHHDNVSGQETPCELCILTFENQHEDLLLTPEAKLDLKQSFRIYQSKITPFNIQLKMGPEKTELFSRPPPA